jgi:hypothetical protein
MLDYRHGRIPSGASTMDPGTNTVDNLLAAMFDNVEEPVYLIDERRGVLFRNVAAHALDALTPPPTKQYERQEQRHHNDESTAPVGELTQLVWDCVRHPRAGSHMHHLIRRDWLICIAPLSGNLAVLYPVFVVHLVSRLQLQRISRSQLHHLFGPASLEWAIITGLAHNDSLHSIAQRTRQSQHAIRSCLKRILARCDVNSSAALLALLHRLARLSA